MATARNDSADDDEAPKAKASMLYEFDCPSCNANNPWPDGFKARDEVICHYCGITYRADVTDEGRLKLREL
jgi:transcription elongation factor Elf1